MPSSSYARLATTSHTFPSVAAPSVDDQDDELDAAFDDSHDPPPEATETDHLVPSAGDDDSLDRPPPSRGEGTSTVPQVPGSYDFERDPYAHPHPPSRPRLVGLGNDGVFANLSAKPGPPSVPGLTGCDKEDALPTYDAAALDAAPPYWDTTVTLPGGVGGYGMLGPDDVLVDGLVVGNLFGFAWNLLVSMSFQFIGFLLTYLLHTTHAAKNGSRAGLGITLIQYGLYTRTRPGEGAVPTPEELARTNGTISGVDGGWGLLGSPSRGDWDGSTTSAPGGREVTQEQMHVSTVANEWLSYMLIAAGWFLLLGGLVNYWRAVSIHTLALPGKRGRVRS